MSVFTVKEAKNEIILLVEECKTVPDNKKISEIPNGYFYDALENVTMSQYKDQSINPTIFSISSSIW